MTLPKLNKEIIITSTFIFFCLLGYIFFPANGIFQNRSVAVLFLVILPYLYNKFFLKKKNLFAKFISIGDWKKNIKYLIIGLLIAALIILIFFKYTELAQHYFLPKNVKSNFINFIVYEITGIVFTVAIYEIFFRGFIQLYFSTFFGKWAVLIQFLIFSALMLALGLPYWFYITYFVFTPFAGWIVYKSESLLYSFIGQCLFIIAIDVSFIALFVK
ncbi:MAG: hypothetical protein US63_C0024G0008 [Candidatus Moranbacteria bacterium GW2011_GWC2_37_8]|nr:MAG: hypothetical protein US63_C0024G0008 [Candidatus Moranbacteria bacterium GW2011_GWC2_37_8]KKQ61486.1 MAG: hypothetical protein US82_C0021G0008 [Parcubacteria group bacterium GW2011_GWC1_38_22]KKQ80925.1 MAG: hypothetical protein UT03_C0016G0002 [Candidatus Moranbacteria bacterium GW2011_GWD2_38_7]